METVDTVETANVVPFAAPSPNGRVPAEEPVEDADDERVPNLAPKRLSATALNAYAANFGDTAGATSLLAAPEFDMYLHQTTINLGMTERFMARVRIVNLADRLIIDTLPPHLRQKAADLFFASGKTPNQFDPMATMNRTTKRSREVANLYACAGFVEPRLVMTQAEAAADPDNVAWVETIALADRLEFVRICEGDENLAMRRLEAFRQ